MNREELLRNPGYWTDKIHYKLYDLLREELKKQGIKKKELAELLGVSKGYITQIFNGEVDHRVSKLVELAMAVGYIPFIEYRKTEEVIYNDINLMNYSSEQKADLNSTQLLKLSSMEPLTICQYQYNPGHKPLINSNRFSSQFSAGEIYEEEAINKAS